MTTRKGKTKGSDPYVLEEWNVTDTKERRGAVDGEPGKVKEKHRHEHHGGSSRDRLDAARILKRMGPEVGEAVLDLGCGDGHFSVAASDVVGEGGVVYALDSFHDSINALKEELAKKEVTNVYPLEFDATLAIPLAQETIDFVLMANVLHGFEYNDELESVMSLLGPLLRPGARLLVIEFGDSPDGKGPPAEVRLTPKKSSEILAKFGFRVTRSEPASDRHYALLMERPEAA